MSSTQPTLVGEDAPPLVLILNNDSSQLEEWLASHPPSRLGMPAAFNNGVVPRPLWVLGVPSMDQLAELSHTITNEETFTKAKELTRDAAAKVSQIQNNDDIPVRSQGKLASKSKKQCRTEVQDTFHDQIIHLAAEHPLCNQGRWTIIMKPSQIDGVFAKLAKSLVSGDLRKHGNILGLRARMLPFEESTFDINKSGPKRPKTSRGRRSSGGSSKSDGSAFDAPKAMLGIDVFFRPAWNSSAARDVLKIIANVSGRMASFCKSSLHSRLGIKSGHQLATHTSLYTSKALTSPADAKLWTREHGSDDGLDDASSQVDAAESSSRGQASASSPDTVISSPPDRPAPLKTTKRQLEQVPTIDATFKAEKPTHKKARNDAGEADEEPSRIRAVETTVPMVEEVPAGVEGSQNEPMLPVRTTSNMTAPNATRSGLQIVLEPEQNQPDTTTSVTPEGLEHDDSPKPTASSAQPKHEENQINVEESQTQTQIKPAPTVDESVVAESSSLKDRDQMKEGFSPPSMKPATTMIPKVNSAYAVSHAEKDGTEVKPIGQPSRNSADELQEIPAANDNGRPRVSVLMASEVKTDLTSPFTPAFSIDVETAPPAVKEAQQVRAPQSTSSNVTIPGLSDLVGFVAEPIVQQQGLSGVRDEKDVAQTVQVKEEPLFASSKPGMLAEPPEVSGGGAAAVGIGALDEAPSQSPQKEEMAADNGQRNFNSTVVPPNEEDKHKTSSAGIEVIAESSQKALMPAQDEKTAMQEDTGAQASEHEKSTGKASTPSTSASDQVKSDETVPTKHTVKQGEEKVHPVETSTSDTAKVVSQAASASGGGTAEMTLEELIVEGATTSPYGVEDDSTK